MKPPQCWVQALGSLLLCFPIPCSLAATDILLRIADQNSGQGIVEATVYVTGLGRHAVSDTSGWVRLDAIDSGVHEARVVAPGYEARPFRLEVKDNGLTQREDIFLRPIVYELETLDVVAQLSDAERDAEAARNSVLALSQVSRESLQDSADDNLGDTLSRLAGVNINTEEGSVTGINIRGAGARQTRITLDGQSVGGAGGRGTTRGARAMNTIPREFLQRIQVMKASTPDMDADAIGGTVDLQTSRIADAQNARSSLSLRVPYSPEYSLFGYQITAAHARPFSWEGEGTRFGALIAANLNRSPFRQDYLQVQNQWPTVTSPTTGEPTRVLARMTVGTSASTREGHGLVFNMDVQRGEDHHLSFKFLYDESTIAYQRDTLQYEFRRGDNAVRLDEQSGLFERVSLEKQFLDRRSKSRSTSLVLAAEHELGAWSLQESIGYSEASNDTPATYSAAFRTPRDFSASYSLARDPFHPEVTVFETGQPLSSQDFDAPHRFALRRFDLIESTSKDEELALQVDATHRQKLEEGRRILKFGLKARLRSASSGQEREPYDPADDTLTLASVATPALDPAFSGLYPLGSGWNADAFATLFREQPQLFELDALNALSSSATSDFKVREKIYAAYGMIERKWKDWTIVGGIRVEHTTAETEGFESITRTSGEGEREVIIVPVGTQDDYSFLFPGAHFLYSPNPAWVLRGSLTRALQRPDFRDLSPSTRIDLDNKRIRSGNPDLAPYDAKAADLGLDFLAGSFGTVSLGVFYKRINDFIVDVEEETEYDGEPGFIRSRPINGSPADLLGIESAWTRELSFLPAPLDSTSVDVNYTWTDSTAAYPGYDDVLIMLPDQVKETLNASLRWRRDRWTFNYRARYRGLQLRDLIEPGDDQYARGYWSHTVSLSWKINDDATLSLSASNLNRPERQIFQGIPERIVNNREGLLSLSLALNIQFGKGGLDVPGTMRSRTSRTSSSETMD